MGGPHRLSCYACINLSRGEGGFVSHKLNLSYDSCRHLGILTFNFILTYVSRYRKGGGRVGNSILMIVVKFCVICVYLSITVCAMYVSGSIALF